MVVPLIPIAIGVLGIGAGFGIGQIGKKGDNTELQTVAPVQNTITNQTTFQTQTFSFFGGENTVNTFQDANLKAEQEPVLTAEAEQVDKGSNPFGTVLLVGGLAVAGYAVAKATNIIK